MCSSSWSERNIESASQRVSELAEPAVLAELDGAPAHFVCVNPTLATKANTSRRWGTRHQSM